jgi:hypothetical protein
MSYAHDSAGRVDGESEDLHLSRDADQIMTEHGNEADHVAAHRADSLFRDGDIVAGARWLKIFRRIALAHRRVD